MTHDHSSNSSDDDSSSNNMSGSSSQMIDPGRYKIHRNLFCVQFALFCFMMTFWMCGWFMPLFKVSHPVFANLTAAADSTPPATTATTFSILSFLQGEVSYEYPPKPPVTNASSPIGSTTSSSDELHQSVVKKRIVPHCSDLYTSGECSITCAKISEPLSALFSVSFFPTLFMFAFMSKAFLKVGLFVCCGGCKREYLMENEKRDPCHCKCCPPRMMFWNYLVLFWYLVSWIPTQIHLGVVLRVFTQQGLCEEEGGDGFAKVSLANDPAGIKLSWSFAFMLLYDIVLTIAIVLLGVAVFSFASDLKQQRRRSAEEKETGSRREVGARGEEGQASNNRAGVLDCPLAVQRDARTLPALPMHQPPPLQPSTAPSSNSLFPNRHYRSRQTQRGFNGAAGRTEGSSATRHTSSRFGSNTSHGFHGKQRGGYYFSTRPQPPTHQYYHSREERPATKNNFSLNEPHGHDISCYPGYHHSSTTAPSPQQVNRQPRHLLL